jgi:hypothetical protein
MNLTEKKGLIEALKADLKKASHPLSAQALLSFEELEFRTLFSRFYHGVEPGSCWGTAEYIVHNLLDTTARKEVFPSPYELGSPEELDPKAVRQSALIAHLETIRPLEDGAEINNVESVLKALKLVVRDLTGCEFKSFTRATAGCEKDNRNHSFAIKVLCTLYRYRMWEPKIFSRFTIPKKPNNFNLELRDAYPLEWADDSPRMGVALFSDLKQSLTFGMSKEEVDILLPAMQRVSNRYAQSSFAPPEVLAFYVENPKINHLTLKQGDLLPLLPLGASRQATRLDIDLYAALVLRESELRLLGKDVINRLLVSEEAAVPTCPKWSIQKLAVVIYALRPQNISALRFGLRRLLDSVFSEKEITKALERHERLIWIVKDPLDKDPSFNPLERLAAVIACLGEAAESVRSKAYWYGKKTSSDNPMFYLDKLESFSSVSQIPEHYQEYWFRRYTLVQSRLVGREDLWHHQNALEQFEGYRVIQVFRTHGVFRAIKIVNAYFDNVPDLAALRKPVALAFSSG